jgi:hypothetical protein
MAQVENTKFQLKVAEETEADGVGAKTYTSTPVSPQQVAGQLADRALEYSLPHANR